MSKSEQGHSEYLTTSAAAAYLGFRPEWLMALRKKRRGPACIKVDGEVRYSKKDIDHWVEANFGGWFKPLGRN